MVAAGDFELVRISLALGMFAAASYYDLRNRSVSDILWVGFAAAAGIIYVFDFPSSFSEGTLTITSIALASAVSYGIYRSGLFGGADMLALVTFAALLPIYNYGPLLDPEEVTRSFHPFAPLIVLTNAVMFSVLQILGNVVRNLSHRGQLFEGLQHEPASKKLLAIMVGHRSRNAKYAFSIERVINGRREFDFGIKPAETAQYETRNDVWVTSATPFLIFIFVGFVAMIFFGDILAVLLGSIL